MVLSFAFLAANDWCVLLEFAAGGSPPSWVTPPVTTQAEVAWLPFWCVLADSCLLRTHRSLLIPGSCSGPLPTDPGSALPLLVSRPFPSSVPWMSPVYLAICCHQGIYIPWVHSSVQMSCVPMPFARKFQYGWGFLWGEWWGFLPTHSEGQVQGHCLWFIPWREEKQCWDT